MKKNNSGFSLVELIIVIAIMAVLIGVLAPQFVKNVEKSRESTDLQNIAEVKTAIETYAADKQLAGGKAITVTISGGASGTIKVAGAGYTTNDLLEYGIADTQNCKSDSWEAFTWTYNGTDATAYQWTDGAATNGDNAKAKGATYFYYNGQSK